MKSNIKINLVILFILLSGSSNALAQDQSGERSDNNPVAAQVDSSKPDWPTYAGSPGGGQYSALSQINKDNVKELEQAWVYHSGDVSDGSDGTAKTPLEVNPILANDKLYICTPYNRVIALDPGTGNGSECVSSPWMSSAFLLVSTLDFGTGNGAKC